MRACAKCLFDIYDVRMGRAALELRLEACAGAARLVAVGLVASDVFAVFAHPRRAGPHAHVHAHIAEVFAHVHAHVSHVHAQYTYRSGYSTTDLTPGPSPTTDPAGTSPVTMLFFLPSLFTTMLSSLT